MKTLITLLLFTVISFGQTTERDTLTSWTDSTAVFNKRTIFEYIDITIKDTTGGSAIADSFAVERYDPYDRAWHRIGAKNTKTWDNEYQLKPGNGQTKTWLVFDFCEFGSYIRVRRLNAGIAGVKSMITFTGKGNCE